MSTTERPPRWRVECPRKLDLTGQTIALTELYEHHRWTVRSPRGVVVFRTPGRDAAIQIAQSMASIDQLLERVDRLEGAIVAAIPGIPNVTNLAGRVEPLRLPLGWRK